mgnify:CR=1 FL=1
MLFRSLAKYKGQQVGTFGNAASFSFYPGKNLGAMGDAGAVITNDEKLANQMAMIARHGGLSKGEHLIEGVNSRLDGLQAAILSVKLHRLVGWTKRRQDIAAEYSQLLSNIPDIIPPKMALGREHVFHLYVIRHQQRDALAKHLALHRVQSIINYPSALPFLPAYARLGHTQENFPNAYSNQNCILSLPIFPELTRGQIEVVVDVIRSFTV